MPFFRGRVGEDSVAKWGPIKGKYVLVACAMMGAVVKMAFLFQWRCH